MRAVEISAPGGPEVLQVVNREVPRPAYGEVLIQVAYAGVNRPDALQRAGLYRPPADASDLPGLECAGVVAAVGAGVSQWAVGDAICALLPGGGYAEYVCAPAGHCLPIPAGMDLRHAACVPETVFTVWSNLFMDAGLRSGEVLLVHGGASGIGTTAIQLAAARGVRVFATAGSVEKCNLCESLGAERAFNYKAVDFQAEMPVKADVILDMVGGDYIARNLRTLAADGRLVQIAFLQGSKAELNFAPLMMRRQNISGSTLRPKSVRMKSEITRQVLRDVWPLLASGRVAPVMDAEFALADAAGAHARMERGDHMGKIVLAVAPELAATNGAR